MNWGVAVVAFIAAIGPFAQVRRLRSASTPQRFIGSGLVLVVVGGIALVASSLLDWLDISQPTMVIAAGLALAVTCAVRLLTHRSVRPLDVGGNSLRLGLVPIGFPVLLPPIVGVLALAGADPLGGLGVLALTAVPLAMFNAERSIGDAPAAVGSIVVATAGIVAGVALTIDGIFAV